VTAQVGLAERHSYNVADTRGDLLLAPWADIGLSGLLGMDAANSETLVGRTGG